MRSFDIDVGLEVTVELQDDTTIDDLRNDDEQLVEYVSEAIKKGNWSFGWNKVEINDDCEYSKLSKKERKSYGRKEKTGIKF